MYNATVRSTLLYGCETWPLRSGDLHRLQVFDHRCLRSIGHFSWKQRITNDEVRHRIFRDPKSSRRLNQIILGTRLRWLGHVLRMNSSRLPKKFLLAEPKLGWKRSRGGQVMTWHGGDERINKKASHRWFLSFTWLGTERPTTRMSWIASRRWLVTGVSGALVVTFLINPWDRNGKNNPYCSIYSPIF